MIQLFPMQEVAVSKAIDYFNSTNKKDEKPVIMVAPTAYGKSIIISELARRIGKVLVIQPSKELLEQNYSKLIALGGEASIYSASMGQKEIGDITYATIGSIKSLGQTFKASGVKCVLVDECHGFVSSSEGMFGSFIREIGVKKVIGLTATPFRLSNYSDRAGNRYSQLNMLTSRKKGCGFFKDIIYCCQIHEIISAGRWSPLTYKHFDFVSTLLRVNSTGAEYTSESVELAFKSNDLIGKVKEYVESTSRKHILVFVPTIAGAYEMSAQIKGSMVVHGDLDKGERDYVINSFRNGKCRVVINVNVLCLDTQTEILCKNGWVKHDEMTKDHEVANWDNGRVYYEKPKKVVKRFTDPNEQMIFYSSREGNFRVTDNHDMVYYKLFRYDEFHKGKAKDFVGKPIIVTNSGVLDFIEDIEVEQEIPLKENRRIAANSYNLRRIGYSYEDSITEAKKRINDRNSLRYKNPKELTKDECWLIGFWIGDGSYGKNKDSGAYVYSLSQSMAYPKIIDKIEEKLIACGFHFSKYVASPARLTENKSIKWLLSLGTGFGNQRKQGVYPILPYLVKNGSKYLHGLDRDQVLSLIEGFWYADGMHGDGSSVPKSMKICNTNKAIMDMIQHLCAVRGIHTNCSRVPNGNGYRFIYNMNINPNKTRLHLGSGKDKITNEGYSDEIVWCVETSSGNIITRRNGRVTVMGNSVGFDYTKIDSIVLARPTMSLAWLYQAIGRGTRIDPEKSDCEIADFVAVTKRFGKIENLVIENRYGTYEVFSGTKKLTDVKIEDIEVGEGERVITEAAAGKLMPFGKNQGTPIAKLQTSYMGWMLENFGGWSAWSELKQDFIDELKARNGF